MYMPRIAPFSCLEYVRAFANPEPLEISSSHFERKNYGNERGGGGRKSQVHKHLLYTRHRYHMQVIHRYYWILYVGSSWITLPYIFQQSTQKKSSRITRRWRSSSEDLYILFICVFTLLVKTWLLTVYNQIVFKHKTTQRMIGIHACIHFKTVKYICIITVTYTCIYEPPTQKWKSPFIISEFFRLSYNDCHLLKQFKIS